MQREAEGSLLGEHVLVQPVSTQEVRLMHTSISSDVRGVHDEMGAVRASVDQIATAVDAFMNTQFAQPSSETNPHS